jgi:hypothetical protein
VSWPDTEPGAPKDQRYLVIQRVDYHLRDYRNHQRGDVASYDHEPAEVDGASIPELLVTLERMQRAVDRPAVIATEHSTTAEHTFVFDEDALCVTAKPDTRFGRHRIDVQFEKHLVHGLSLECARKLLEQLQAPLSEVEVVGDLK